MNNTRNILTPLLAALLIGTSLASAQTQQQQGAAAPPAAQGQAFQRGARPARGPITVKYYSGNPLKGGALISTATIQPQSGSATPFANAPKGATYVALTTPFGTRISTLKDAQAQPSRGGAQRGGEGLMNGAQSGPGRATNPQGRGGLNQGATVALHLPGLQGASRVSFYAGDPLAGGAAQTSVALSGTPSAQQQQALTQAAAKAKFVVIERSGETLVVNLSALQRGASGTAR